MRGIVKWFDNKKGFGFLNAEGVDGDIFVHYSVVQGDGFKALYEGDAVDFDYTESNKGLRAERVEKIESESALGKGPEAAVSTG